MKNLNIESMTTVVSIGNRSESVTVVSTRLHLYFLNKNKRTSFRLFINGEQYIQRLTDELEFESFETVSIDASNGDTVIAEIIENDKEIGMISFSVSFVGVVNEASCKRIGVKVRNDYHHFDRINPTVDYQQADYQQIMEELKQYQKEKVQEQSYVIEVRNDSSKQEIISEEIFRVRCSEDEGDRIAKVTGKSVLAMALSHDNAPKIVTVTRCKPSNLYASGYETLDDTLYQGNFGLVPN